LLNQHQHLLQKNRIPMVNFIQTFPHNHHHFSVLDGSEYLIVYNRPKQYYGSLYEPDKQ
jgi:hypothetical protein